MTTFQMLKEIRDSLAAIAKQQRGQFDLLSDALGNVLSDLDHIKSQVAVRKVGRRVVHSSRKALKP
jgi:hypothetical protein